MLLDTPTEAPPPVVEEAPLGTGSFLDTFKDVRGSYSSKRILAFIAMALFVGGVFFDTFTSVHPHELYMQGFFSIVMAGVGMAGLEHFTARK